MHAGLSSTFAFLGIFSFSLLQPALADDKTDAARLAISGQISAFLNDDAEKAYSFASPDIKARFPDAERFFDMVKQTYTPVYRPGNYAFGRSKFVADGNRAYQEVLISGKDGKDWAVYYDLMRQPDGRYVINGVKMTVDTLSRGI